MSLRHSPHPASRSGFTRAELVMLLGILVTLAAVMIGPVANYFQKARIDRAVDNVRAINLLLSQYATDNNDTYPVGLDTPAVGKSEGIALNLLQNKYAPDASIFAVVRAHQYNGAGTDFSDFTAANIDWDFTAGATTSTGINASASGDLPTVYCTGETVTYPAPGDKGLDLVLSGKNPLGKNGIAVGYKDNSAMFVRATFMHGTPTAVDFILKKFSDPGTYTQIKP